MGLCQFSLCWELTQVGGNGQWKTRVPLVCVPPSFLVQALVGSFSSLPQPPAATVPGIAKIVTPVFPAQQKVVQPCAAVSDYLGKRSPPCPITAGPGLASTKTKARKLRRASRERSLFTLLAQLLAYVMCKGVWKGITPPPPLEIGPCRPGSVGVPREVPEVLLGLLLALMVC